MTRPSRPGEAGDPDRDHPQPSPRGALPDGPSLRRALGEYSATIESQGVKKLPDLDTWYRQDLPRSIAARSPAHLTRPELVRLTEWKMARGVWRAPNLALVRQNSDKDVRETSTEALGRIPHPTAPISVLAKLRGIGPATASAAIAAAAPDRYPFFDELVAEQLPGLGPVAWTLTYYARYADALRDAANALGGDWTPADLERALWSYVGGKVGAKPA
ncbi:MAG: hypothetical protein H0U67_07605 [Gemmatimonadetes bacterium]|nr:hypothetical protein [Gemmatimonadota bacterium]